ncbi:hypothetical protein [Bartonella sp. HY038]|uniref:5' nucleotidase, NT5C type n=1 Tax=Bartonella sp. HY038 TaxID=2759660 RepID=UPI0015FAC7E3|nr:hypothetical protein [Bartonella sp. HY038]
MTSSKDDKWNEPFNPMIEEEFLKKYNIKKTTKNTLFIDMDGVLVDFDKGYENYFGYKPTKVDDNVDWALVNGVESYYANIPPMEDFKELWEGIAHYNPIILTGVPKEVPSAADDKRKWVDKHIGKSQLMITCLSKDKSLHMKNKGDILIDDWTKYQHLWIERGGRWITHMSAEQSLAELEMSILMDDIFV